VDREFLRGPEGARAGHPARPVRPIAAPGCDRPIPLSAAHPVDAKREQLVAIVDSTTILAGDRFIVERAIDRQGLKTVDARLADAATALRDRYWIWVVADRLDGPPRPRAHPRVWKPWIASNSAWR